MAAWNTPEIFLLVIILAIVLGIAYSIRRVFHMEKKIISLEKSIARMEKKIIYGKKRKQESSLTLTK